MDSALPVLEGARVVLREPADADAAALFDALGHADVRRWVHSATRAADAAGMSEFLERCRVLRMQDRVYTFVIADRADGQPIGLTWFSQVVPRLRAEMGTWLGKPAWGTGMYAEVKALCLAFAFGELRLRRIEGRIAVSNTRMQRAFEKIGAVREGRLRDAFVKGDYVEDEYLYSITAADYASGRLSVLRPDAITTTPSSSDER